ncbi:hypothetical protein Gohar_015721, partial [Gossypium harknessii]|nr:hypothetical protein [Gossypium harknessii]
MHAFYLNGDLSIAYKLFNKMFKRDVMPNVEFYRILMQGICRKSQVNKIVDLLEDMLNKGFVLDSLSYTTLLNSLCRKKKLREAYKLLCRMKVKGCNLDIVHYNTFILGFCRKRRAMNAVKDNFKLGYQWYRPCLYHCNLSCCYNKLPACHHFFLAVL